MKSKEVQSFTRFSCINHKKGLCSGRGKKKGGVKREAARLEPRMWR